MFLHVSSVEYIKAYVLEITFSDGVRKHVNLAEELMGPVFEPLRDKELFSQVYLDPETRTIAWSTGADLAPEYLYELGQDVRQAA